MSYIYDFDESVDRLDLSALLTEHNAATDNLNDFVIVAQGGNMTFQVDSDGAGTTYGGDNVVRLQGNTTIGTDVDQLVLDGTFLL